MHLEKNILFICSSDKELIMRIESPDTSIIHQGDKIVYFDNISGFSVETNISFGLPVEQSADLVE